MVYVGLGTRSHSPQFSLCIIPTRQQAWESTAYFSKILQFLIKICAASGNRRSIILVLHVSAMEVKFYRLSMTYMLHACSCFSSTGGFIIVYLRTSLYCTSIWTMTWTYCWQAFLSSFEARWTHRGERTADSAGQFAWNVQGCFI